MSAFLTMLAAVYLGNLAGEWTTDVVYEWRQRRKERREYEAAREAEAHIPEERVRHTTNPFRTLIGPLMERHLRDCLECRKRLGIEARN